MKLTHNTQTKLKPGMTLIELTVVIIVLLTLISVLFFAGTAYIKASNRTACLANQATFQKSMRGFATLSQIEPGSGTAIAWGAVGEVGTVQGDGFIGDYLNMVCPSGKEAYEPAEENPEAGVQVAPCTDTSGPYAVGVQAAGYASKDDADAGMHIPGDIGNW